MTTKDLRLDSKNREIKGRKVKRLRKNGSIPAVLYGTGIKEPISLEVDYKEFSKVYQEGGENTLIKLNIEGDKAHNIVIHEIQKDPVSDKYIHIDFHAVSMTEKIVSNIPLKFEGVSDAIKNLGGVLVIGKDEVEVESLPTDIPSEIIVNISKIKTFDDILRVKDLDIPEKVTVLDDAESVLVAVTPPRVEEEPEAEKATEGVTAEAGEEKKDGGSKEESGKDGANKGSADKKTEK